MCGRAYSTYTEDELRVRYLNERDVELPELKANYNMSPTQSAPIVRVEEGRRRIDLLRWGLVPFWAKDAKIGYKMINARSESVAEKPAFRAAFKKRRCIIPVSGFFEWKRPPEGAKRPFRIFLKDEPIMSIAGIWEHWAPEGQKELFTFSILTTSANRFMARIHDRMPVILGRGDESAWLEPKSEDPEKLGKLLKPCPDKWLEAVEVSTLVNSPKNNRKEVLEPL